MTIQTYCIVTTGPYRVPGPTGAMVDVPVGSTVNRVVLDPADGWTPPANTQMVPDNGTPIWTPPMPPAPNLIDAYVWLQRLPQAVQVSVATAAQSNPQLLVGLTLMSAAGTIDLNDPTGQIAGFLNLAMNATATMANPLTAAMVAAMMQP